MKPAGHQPPKPSEMMDVPFLSNDMKGAVPTMDKPLDTADAPGKADSEMTEDESC